MTEAERWRYIADSLAAALHQQAPWHVALVKYDEAVLKERTHT